MMKSIVLLVYGIAAVSAFRQVAFTVQGMDNKYIAGLLPDVWESLGPFPHGSRETGVDPLSAYGGFEKLVYDENSRYPSDIADGGWVTWRKVQTNADGTVGPLDYPSIRWAFNEKPFGWTVLHHTTYFRGKLTIPTAGTYLVSFSRVVSFKIDHRAFVGNIYEYSHASGTAVWLDAGDHMLYVASVMDVRLFGGQIPPKTSFHGEIQLIDTIGPSRGIVVFPKDSILPDIIDGRLATVYARVTLMNANVLKQSVVSNDRSLMESKYGPGWVQIVSVDLTANGETVKTDLTTRFSVNLAPGQVVPIPFSIDDRTLPFPSSISIRVTLMDLDSKAVFTVPIGDFQLENRKWGDTYKITFPGFDQWTQAAMVKPPRKTCVRPHIGCPIIVALHGAGVQFDSTFWVDAVKQQDYAWVLLPSGRTSWGFDWHGPSFMNIDSAIDVLAYNSPGVPSDIAEQIKAEPNRLIYMGHSNGGQGAWWLLTHHPDNAIAAVPAAAYAKIQHYIPYYMHVGYSYCDPMLRGILESSISENDLDLHAPNAVGIPLLARVGSDDDNVPPLHSRRLVRLLNEWERNPDSYRVSEAVGQGHWFDGVLSDQVVQEFIDAQVDPVKNPDLKLPPLPAAFTIQTLNPSSTGSRGGIRILQLEVPFRLGTIRVHRQGSMWILNTTNVRRFGFTFDERQQEIQSWSIDGTTFSTPPSSSGLSYLKEGMSWQLASDLLWISRERHPSTYGPASIIFSTPFRIVIPTDPGANVVLYRQLAQHIASSWYLYGFGGTQIVTDVEVLDGLAASYNLIVLGGPKDNMYTRKRESQGNVGLVQFLASGGVRIGTRQYELPGTGVLFLAPSPTRTRIGLFVAGIDEEGLKRAVWSIPFRTGLEVPDYLVVGDEYGDPATGWTAGEGSPFGGAGTKGAGGVFAAGFWNNTWDFDDRCGYLK